DAARLTLPERDLLLAAIWRMTAGSRIAGTLTCSTCKAPFDFDFDLDTLADRARVSTGDLPAHAGVYELSDRCRFRLPTGEDERAVAELPEDEAERALLQRCLIAGDADADGPAAIEAMERVGSGVDVDFDAACAECGSVQTVRFQIQSYLLGALAMDWG